MAQTVKNSPAIRETWVLFPNWEDSLKKGPATHSSILAWRIPWTRSLAGYSPWGHRVGHDWATFSFTHLCVLVTQSCQTLCNPMGCSLPCSSLPGILQARILEWVAIPFSRGILPAQTSNQGVSLCRQILYHLRYQGNISCKNGLNKGQKWYGPNRSRRY